MILLLAVLAGLLAGAARARQNGRGLRAPDLRLIGLAPLAFLPQWLAFYLPASRRAIPGEWAAAILVSSQALLLVFAWVNRRQPGFWALGLGLAMNLLVITLNGGLMPISPERLAQLAPGAPSAWQVGHRLGKDIVLLVANTRLWWLSDCLLLPAWFPHRVAFSLGDVFIALGAFGLLWAMGGPPYKEQKESDHETDIHCKGFTQRGGTEPVGQRGYSE